MPPDTWYYHCAYMPHLPPLFCTHSFCLQLKATLAYLGCNILNSFNRAIKSFKVPLLPTLARPASHKS
jgi:hypothetical protein